MYKRIYVTSLAVVTAAASLISTSLASAAPIYKESFQFCPRVAADRLLAPQLVGWTAMRKGRAPNDMGVLKSSRPGNIAVTDTSVRAFPVGTLTGNVLWTKPTTGLTVFTQEFSFDIGSIKKIRYDQRLDGFDLALGRRNGSRLALLVDGVWYLSDKTFHVAKRSVWESVEVSVHEMTYGIIAGSASQGPTTPANSGFKLPTSGAVTAFGVYFPRVSNRVRIDNYEISDDSLASPTLDSPDLSPCYSESLALATPTSTPASTPTSTPVTTPTPTVVAGGTVLPTATPTSSSPTPSPAAPNPIAPAAVATPASRALFCSQAQLVALGNLKVPKRFNKLVVTSLPGRSLKGLRDRFLMAIVLEKNPRLDLLVNAVVNDYDPLMGILKLPTNPRADGDFTAASANQDFVLSKFARAQGTRYLRRYLRDGNRNKYLFPRVNRGTERLIDTALCSPQLRRLIRLRAERAGFRIRFNNP